MPLQTVEEMFEDGRGSGVLVECAEDDNPKVRALAALLLSDCRYSSEVVDALNSLLQDHDAVVVKTAIYSLTVFGGRSRSAVPALLLLAQGSDGDLQWASRKALWSIDQQAAIKLEGWKRIDRDDLGFSAEMPTPVNVDESPISTPAGELALARFESQAGLAFYSIAVSEMSPEGVEALKVKGWFEDHVRSAAEKLQGDIVEQKILDYHGRSAFFFTLRKNASDGSLEMDIETWAIPIGNRLYQAVFVFPSDDPPNRRSLDFFLDSFVIRYESSFEE